VPRPSRAARRSACGGGRSHRRGHHRGLVHCPGLTCAARIQIGRATSSKWCSALVPADGDGRPRPTFTIPGSDQPSGHRRDGARRRRLALVHLGVDNVDDAGARRGRTATCSPRSRRPWGWRPSLTPMVPLLARRNAPPAYTRTVRAARPLLLAIVAPLALHAAGGGEHPVTRPAVPFGRRAPATWRPRVRLRPAPESTHDGHRRTALFDPSSRTTSTSPACWWRGADVNASTSLTRRSSSPA
jgi:hypothetical protein